METWDAIRARRNTREFADRPLAGADLDRILEAGRRTPSATNWQPWDFVVVTDAGRRRALSELRPGAFHLATAQAAVALVATVPETDGQRAWVHYDLGQATMSMMLAATDLGIGTGHVWVDDQPRLREILGFPEGKFCAYLISLGYPAAGPFTPIQRPDRRPFDEVVHREHW